MIDAVARVEALKPSWLGRFVYAVFPYRRRVILANISQVYGDHLSAAQKKKLAQAFYGHLLTSIKEMVQLRFISEQTLRSSVTVIGADRIMALAKEGKGVLILTGHFGNWEFAPLGGILNFKTYQGQFHFIRKTLGVKWIERLLFKRYFDAGLQVIAKKNSLNQVCEALEQGHAVVFVMDQHASLANKDGIAVEFFGKKAGTYRSLATIARYTGLPVVPAAGYRLENGKHVLEFSDPIVWQDAETPRAALECNTRAYNRALERLVLAHPEQWLWLHKRWKL